MNTAERRGEILKILHNADAPVAARELAGKFGVSRQVSVLAYQFGDGFSNIFWPTSVFMMCGIMRLPINKWYRFVTPLFLIIFAASIVLLGAAVVIGY